MKTVLRIMGTWLMFVALLFGTTYYLFYGSGVGELSGIVRSYLNPCYGSTVIGTHGRFQVPDLGIDVALYDYEVVDKHSNTAQVINASDSALFKPWGTADGFVGDHCSPDGGFNSLKYAVPGKTVAQIVYADGTTERWRCMIVDRHCSGWHKTIYDSTGADTQQLCNGGIWTFTCANPYGTSTTGVWWERIEN